MPIVFWSVVLGGLVALTFVLNRRKRRKYANLAAHMTKSGATDAQISGAQNLGNATAQGTTPGGFKGDVPYL